MEIAFQFVCLEFGENEYRYDVETGGRVGVACTLEYSKYRKRERAGKQSVGEVLVLAPTCPMSHFSFLRALALLCFPGSFLLSETLSRAPEQTYVPAYTHTGVAFYLFFCRKCIKWGLLVAGSIKVEACGCCAERAAGSRLL